MKKLLLCALLALAASAHAQQQPPIDGSVTLFWDYPADKLAGVTFRVYHSPDLVTPVNQWACIGATNEATQLPLVVAPGANFFVCTASNFWGTSSFSSVARTPGLVLSDFALGIRKGH